MNLTMSIHIPPSRSDMPLQSWECGCPGIPAGEDLRASVWRGSCSTEVTSKNKTSSHMDDL